MRLKNITKAVAIEKMFKYHTEEKRMKYQKHLLQILRLTEDEQELSEICVVLMAKGSVFVIPTLMARLKDTNVKLANLSEFALGVLQAKVADREKEKMKKYFDPSWWVPKWTGSQERFLSFVALVAMAKYREFNDEQLDEVGKMIMDEMIVDISPFNTINELRVCTNWDIEKDIMGLLSTVAGDLSLMDVFDIPGITSDPETIYEDNILNMRADYLVTRLKLANNYKEHHYLLKTGLGLNR